MPAHPIPKTTLRVWGSSGMLASSNHMGRVALKYYSRMFSLDVRLPTLEFPPPRILSKSLATNLQIPCHQTSPQVLLHAGLGFAPDYPTYGPVFRSLISIDPSLSIAELQHEMIQPQQQWLDNLQITFIRRSIKIISRYFQEVLLAVAELHMK